VISVDGGEFREIAERHLPQGSHAYSFVGDHLAMITARDIIDIEA